MQNHLIITSNGAVWTLFATKRNRCPKVPTDHPGDSREKGLAVSLSGESMGSVKGAGVGGGRYEQLRKITKNYEILRKVTKYYEKLRKVTLASPWGG